MAEKLITDSQLRKILYGVATGTPSSNENNTIVNGIPYTDNLNLVTNRTIQPATPFDVKDVLVNGNNLFIFSDTACYRFTYSGWEKYVDLLNTYDGLFFDTVVYNGLIYIFGKGRLAETIDLNTKAQNRVSSSSLPYDIDIKSAVVYNGKIHVMGSNGNADDRTKHFAYDGSSWQSVSTLPLSFVGDNCTLVMSDGIHLFFSTKHYLWNGSDWSELTGNTSAINIDGVALNYNNEIHILDGSTSANEHYVLRNNTWTKLSDLPCATKNAVVYRGKIYMFDLDESSNKIYTYNGTNWSELSYTCYKLRSE